jgi:hypothetical protein
MPHVDEPEFLERGRIGDGLRSSIPFMVSSVTRRSLRSDARLGSAVTLGKA